MEDRGSGESKVGTKGKEKSCDAFCVFTAAQERVWKSFPQFCPSSRTTHRVIVDDRERYIPLMLDLTLLCLYELGVYGELPLIVWSED